MYERNSSPISYADLSISMADWRARISLASIQSGAVSFQVKARELATLDKQHLTFFSVIDWRIPSLMQPYQTSSNSQRRAAGWSQLIQVETL